MIHVRLVFNSTNPAYTLNSDLTLSLDLYVWKTEETLGWEN
jgi:hypothetical protein